MNVAPTHPPDPPPGRTTAHDDLRERAEARLRVIRHAAGAVRDAADAQRLIHELQVHQVELEMQNEELQSARTAIEAGLSKYSDLYDFAPVGYLTLDRPGSILEANLAAAALLGFERSRLLGRDIAPLVDRADRSTWAAFLTKVFAATDRAACDVSLPRSGRAPLAVHVEGERSAGADQCRVILIDITERQRAEEDRLVRSKLESTGLLAGGLAHDFNNLLTVILLNLEDAQATGGDDAILQASLKEAKEASLTARGLTQQLITFAKGGAPVRKPTELPRLIQDAVRLGLSGSNARADVSLAEDLWPADGDEGQLSQVIRNLVLNARQAMPEGGTVAVRGENVQVARPARPDGPTGPCIRITITDHGSGISAEALPRIFDPYFSRKPRGIDKGVGLGLTICHAIMQKHGGSIDVQSSVGVGTSFQLHLPACATPVDGGVAPATPTHAGPWRILVMDDEEAVGVVLEALLQRLGHDTMVVENGDAALVAFTQARADSHPFDLVLLDLTIRAGLGGQATAAALHRIAPDVRAVAMSGYSENPVILMPHEYGFRAALAKPFISDQVRQALARAMMDQARPAR